jgi:glycosyltransferase involved in cell wall biosynthesis
LLFLGQLGRRKGTSDLFHALAQVDADWRLVLAGDGEIREMQELAARLSLSPRCRFTGWVGRDAVGVLLDQAEVLVLPSHAEGLPLAVLEAMARGLAIVTTPVGALPEVVQPWLSGVLVQPGDVAALAESLERLIADDRLRWRLGAAARAIYEREFRLDRMIEDLLAEYGEISGRTVGQADDGWSFRPDGRVCPATSATKAGTSASGSSK